MSNRDGFSGFGVFLAFVGGAAAGAAVALLVAPATGDEARVKIKDAMNKVPKALKNVYAHASEAAHDVLKREEMSSLPPIERRNGEIT
jgi:gas vesicle protein